MLFGPEVLDYEHHKAQFRDYLRAKPDDWFWHFRAQDSHTLAVIDAVRDVQVEILIVAQQIPCEAAYHHLVFGAARRSRMIWGGLRQLYGLISPDRDEPLPHDDVFEASRALNDIYIHARGTLDNYAWALFHLYGGNDKDVHPNDIGLFTRRFRNDARFASISEITAPYETWNNELRDRRDPVAHRIPLSVAPALLSEADQIDYKDLMHRYNEAQRSFFSRFSGKFDQAEADAMSAEVDSLHQQLQKLGRFAPFIVHDPSEGGTRIYPTVPQDVGMLVKITKVLNSHIAENFPKD